MKRRLFGGTNEYIVEVRKEFESLKRKRMGQIEALRVLKKKLEESGTILIPNKRGPRTNEVHQPNLA